MTRRIVATPLFARHLERFLDEYAAKGAVRFIERFHGGYRAMLDAIARFDAIAPVRRRSVAGRSVTLREYVLDAGAREFVILYWVPPKNDEPIVLINIRIGGQNRFRWKS
jgi:hypothetical protein